MFQLGSTLFIGNALLSQASSEWQETALEGGTIFFDRASMLNATAFSGKKGVIRFSDTRIEGQIANIESKSDGHLIFDNGTQVALRLCTNSTNANNYGFITLGKSDNNANDGGSLSVLNGSSFTATGNLVRVVIGNGSNGRGSGCKFNVSNQSVANISAWEINVGRGADASNNVMEVSNGSTLTNLTNVSHNFIVGVAGHSNAFYLANNSFYYGDGQIGVSFNDIAKNNLLVVEGNSVFLSKGRTWGAYSYIGKEGSLARMIVR